MRPRARIASLAAAALASVAVGVLGTPSAMAQATPCQPGTPDPGGEWRSYGHDLANTRFQSEENTIGTAEAATLKPAWTFNSSKALNEDEKSRTPSEYIGGGGGGDFTATPVVADGCVFVGSNRGWVFAIDADSGERVWAAQVPELPTTTRDNKRGVVNASVAVDDGKVFVAVSHPFNPGCNEVDGDPANDCLRPYMVAFDQTTGEQAWGPVQIDDQEGSDVYGSPVYYDGMVIMGVSAIIIETDGDVRRRGVSQGSTVLLDAETGEMIEKIYSIQAPVYDESDPNYGYSGATVWASVAVDERTGMGYIPTGNPDFKEHERSNAILKVDLNRESPTFGEVLDSYKGTPDTYFEGGMPGAEDQDCPTAAVSSIAPFAPDCWKLDLDFGASPNLMTDSAGRTIVGAGQKSGVYHAVDTETMDGVWKTTLGIPSGVGGIVGSTAYDGESIYGPVTVPGYLWSLEKETGTPRWVSPVGDGVHWGNPVSVANDVAYTTDLKGFLNAYDTATGAPILHRPMQADTAQNTGADSFDGSFSWGGVSIARNTVFASTGVAFGGQKGSYFPSGSIIAYKPAAELKDVTDAAGTTGGSLGGRSPVDDVHGPTAEEGGSGCEASVVYPQCDYSKSLVPMPTSARVVAATVPLRTDNGDRAERVYRSLIPEPFEMPDEPMVGLMTTDASPPRDLGLADGPVDFMEGPVSIRVKRPLGDGTYEHGWFHLSEATNSRSAYDLGRPVGLPKYMADMSMTQTQYGWRALTTHGEGAEAVEAVDLRWESCTSPAAAADCGEVPAALEDWTLQKDPFFGVKTPAADGARPLGGAECEPSAGADCTAHFTKFTAKPYAPIDDSNVPGDEPDVGGVTALPAPEAGTVNYDVFADLDELHTERLPEADRMPAIFRGATLADVICPAGSAPGMFWDPSGVVFIQSGALDDGGASGVYSEPAQSGTPSGDCDDGSTEPDTTAPETAISTQLGILHPGEEAQVSFSSSEAKSSFRCAVDSGAFADCASPHVLRADDHAVGRHVLRVRAVDAAGNADPTPAREYFHVAGPAPEASGPQGAQAGAEAQEGVAAGTGAAPPAASDSKLSRCLKQAREIKSKKKRRAAIRDCRARFG
jgi:polyvinyl alcohol dehydrogenase (cytochrome)